MPQMRYNLVKNIEEIVVMFLRHMVSRNFQKCNSSQSLKRKRFCLTRRSAHTLTQLDEIMMYLQSSLQRSSLSFYILMEAHNILLSGGKCTLRELYYKDPARCCSSSNVGNTVRDICGLLKTTPWALGIFSCGKSLIAGPIRLVMISGDIIDCHSSDGAVLLPQDCNSIDYMETSASFVLLVEKYTVFSKLMSQNILSTIGCDVILMTGKGYPDQSIRLLLNRLQKECFLPIYSLFDCDPFGIDILLTYRNGSHKMHNFGVSNLFCPQIHWLGIHPSEVCLMNFPTFPLTNADKKKLLTLQKRMDLTPGIQHELHVLNYMQKKIQIDALSTISTNFLLNDYVPNKIKRRLFH